MADEIFNTRSDSNPFSYQNLNQMFNVRRDTVSASIPEEILLIDPTIDSLSSTADYSRRNVEETEPVFTRQGEFDNSNLDIGKQDRDNLIETNVVNNFLLNEDGTLKNKFKNTLESEGITAFVKEVADESGENLEIFSTREVENIKEEAVIDSEILPFTLPTPAPIDLGITNIDDSPESIDEPIVATESIDVFNIESNLVNETDNVSGNMIDENIQITSAENPPNIQNDPDPEDPTGFNYSYDYTGQ